MKGIYRHILNVSFIMTTVWFSSCSNEENLGGELKELKTISSITINQTIYNTSDNVICMLPGQNVQLDCTILPEDAEDKSIKWTSSDEEVATVTTDGLLSANLVGTSVIRVTPAIGFGSVDVTPSYTLNVVDNFVDISGISFTNIDDILQNGLGQSTSYKVELNVSPENATFKRFKWESLTPEVATVDADGVITAISPGQAKIKVTADDFSETPVSMELVFNVFEAVAIENIEFKDEAVTYLSQFGYGEVYDLKNAVTLTPSYATVGLISWSSDNESVVSVDKDGILTAHAVKAGEATITATAGEITKTVKVTMAVGRLWYSFDKSYEPWYIRDGGVANVENGKTRVTLKDKNMGAFAFTCNNEKGTIAMNTSHPILAIKIMLPYKYVVNNNSQGTLFLDTNNGRYMQTSGNGNNVFTVLRESEYTGNIPTTPMVIYMDMTKGFGNTPHYLPAEPAAEDLRTFQFGVYDYNKVPENLGYYDMYWIRSFKTVEELKTFVNSENNN